MCFFCLPGKGHIGNTNDNCKIGDDEKILVPRLDHDNLNVEKPLDEDDSNDTLQLLCSGVVMNRDSILKVCGFLKPRELLAITQVNKALRHVIANDYSVTIGVGLMNGGRSKRSLENLFRLIQAQAIYIPKPLRILCIINVVRCEFCNRKNTHYLRPNFCVMACWNCLKRRHVDEFGYTGEQYDSLSARWFKVTELFQTGFFMKQFYFANRHVIYEILSHSRVICYPSGTRYFKRVGGDLIPTARRSSSTEKSQDAYEIMWLKSKRDACGDLIGPLVCKSNISEAVTFIRNEEEIGTLYNSRRDAVGVWIQECIEDCPYPSQYTLISRVYESLCQVANQKEILCLA